jgi:hypothetical protein
MLKTSTVRHLRPLIPELAVVEFVMPEPLRSSRPASPILRFIFRKFMEFRFDPQSLLMIEVDFALAMFPIFF